MAPVPLANQNDGCAKLQQLLPHITGLRTQQSCSWKNPIQHARPGIWTQTTGKNLTEPQDSRGSVTTDATNPQPMPVSTGASLRLA